jgi:ZIP family zinc transporter
MIILACIVAFLATLSGGLFALKFKDKLHLILGFSAGAVIGVVFFDLLPEAIDLGKNQYNAGQITAVTMFGFLFYMILDRLALLHSHDDHSGHGKLKSKFGAGSLSIHSLLDGVAIGWAFQVSPSIGILIALAVVAHDFSDGINTVSIIMKEKGEDRVALKWLLIDAIAPVIGVISTFFVSVPDASFGIVLALFAGFFLYIGASDLLPQSHSQYPKIWTTIMTIMGAGVTFLVTRLSGL